MDTLISDIRYAFRQFSKSPGFVLIAVLTLALGIGANTTIFSIINATLLKPLPYAQPDRLVAVLEANAHDPTDFSIVSVPNFQDWRRQNNVFEDMALVDSSGRGFDLASPGQQPERVNGGRISAGFFPVLGVTPILGRTFLPEEEWPGKDHVVILSYSLWRDRYHADPALLGKPIRIDSERYTVVGITPPSFQFQLWSNARLLWVPIGYTAGDADRGAHSFIVLARMKPGITIGQARADMDAIGHRLASAYPQDNAGRTAIAVPLKDFDMGGVRGTMLALLAAVGLVLLIACVNVANLMLARGASRQKEIAMRAALGAGRFRIVRQLLTESVLLALLGGSGGLLLTSWTSGFLLNVLPGDFHYLPLRPLETISVDGKVLAFTLCTSCLTAILFGLMPALGALRSDVNDLLRTRGGGSAGKRSGRFGYALVASEVALTMVVLASAGLMIESMTRLLAVAPGFDPKNVLILSATTPQVDLYNGPPVNARFCQNLQDRIGALPGIVSVSSASALPMLGRAGRGFAIEGRPNTVGGDQPGAAYSVACPNLLQTLRIPIIAGRDFSFRDTVNSPGVIVINQALARRYWPNEDPLGKRIKLTGISNNAPWLTIVGVYRDVRNHGLDELTAPEFLRPYSQAAWPSMAIAVRTASAPAAYEKAIRRAFTAIDPDRAVTEIGNYEDLIQDSVGSRRFPMFVLASLAVLGLVLAAVGIAGVVSYSVAQRTNEIGIRMALGARPRDVLGLVVRRSMLWAAIGVAAGLLASLALTRLLSDLLYSVRPTDPAVLGSVAFLLAGIALLASYLPARRATKVDPMVALHEQ